MRNREDKNRSQMIPMHTAENTNVAFITIEENRKISFFNKAAKEFFGYLTDGEAVVEGGNFLFGSY